jgi:thiosulfate/3-mercaptopyruvate sulfurtransferase
MKRGFVKFIPALMMLGILFLAGCGSSVEDKAGGSTTYPNASLLVSGSSLQSMSASNRVIIDVRSSTDYNNGHIPGAINIPVAWGGAPFDDPSSSHTAADWQYYELKSASDIAAYLGGEGVSNTNTIIVYGPDVDPQAGRMFWMLEYLGAEDVHVLDGGYSKWVSDGRTTTTTATTLAAATFNYTVTSSRLATKADVLAHYTDPYYAIVDSRNAADAGPTVGTGSWLQFNTQHIPNAVNILIGDFQNSDKTVKSYGDIKTLLDGKGVTASKTVITNCYVGYRSAQQYFIFRLMGYNVSNYDGSWSEWNADATYLPRETSLIVSGAWLNTNLTNANQVIIDVRQSTDYNTGHIPGAINIPMAWGGAPFDQDTAGWQHYELLPSATIAGVLGNYGVSNTNTIIVYGANADQFILPGRMFWMLEYLGATDVRVLDGGYDKWASAGYTTSTTATTLAAATFTPSVFAARLSTKADVLAHYADTTNYAVVDSRNSADYVTSHIPNAINLLIGDFLNTDNTVKSFTGLKTLLDGNGVTAGKTVIAHCYVGYRSSQEYLMFRVMGFNVSNYDGSWNEWISDPAGPTAP